MYLSKSTYCNGVQCPKMVWMKANRPEVYDSSCMNHNALKNGTDVGELARGLFGDYIEVKYCDSKEVMVRDTQKLLDCGVKNIAEATFYYNNCLCRVDILRNLGNKQIEIYEVKSSTEQKKSHLSDLAFQSYLLNQLGFEIKKACIVHINKKYERHGGVDITQLFTICDLTKTVQNSYDEIKHNILLLNDYLNKDNEPNDAIGKHCFHPYKCGFWKYCSKHLPCPSVYDLKKGRWGFKINDIENLYNKGITSFNQLFQAKCLPEKQAMQVNHELNNCPPIINKENIRKFTRKVTYPIYFLDFETISFPIPRFDNSFPYEKIPFQYSLHILKDKRTDVVHKEYLAKTGIDPRRDLAEHLCHDIPKDSCIVAYNSSFETHCIERLAQLFPDLADKLLNMLNNVQDIMKPFEKRDYYCKDMQGSYSLKKVLPALFPNDESLKYTNLEGVHNAAEAPEIFIKMENMPSNEQEKCRQWLLSYCKLDTLGMVKIFEVLSDI